MKIPHLHLGRSAIKQISSPIIVDDTAWMIDNVISDILLMPGGMLYMFLLGCKFLLEIHPVQILR